MTTPNDQPADEPSDLDEENPVDLTSEGWTEVYGRMDDPESFLEHDHSMDG